MTSVTHVTNFRFAPVGVHICFRRHTPFDPSSCNMFAAASNHLSYRVPKTPSFSTNAMVASIYCAFVIPIPWFWCWCATLNVPAATNPAISEYFTCAPLHDNALSRCCSTLRTSGVSPHPRNGKNLPLTNLSTSERGSSAHWDRNLCQDLCFLQWVIKIEKSKILHCKKAWSNNDMSLLQHVKETIN